MSFQILKKRTRRTVGTLSALFFTGFMIVGFIDSYIKIKNRQIKKVDLVEVLIVADKPAGEAVLYESVRGEQCIKQLTENIAIKASSVSSSPMSAVATSSIAASVSSMTVASSVSSLPATSKIVAIASSKANKKNQPVEPPLIAAKSPSCIAQSVVPVGFEQLGAAGFVGLQLNIAANGSVMRGEIETSSGFTQLDAAALKQVTETWRFEPCKKAGAAVNCKHRIRFRWEVK